MSKYPFNIAGSNRLCSVLNSEFKKDIFGKSGAEGCYACSLKNLGLGLVLKCRDGSKRGVEVALGHLLKQLEYVSSKELSSFFDLEVNTVDGKK